PQRTVDLGQFAIRTRSKRKIRARLVILAKK
ncbi:MAG: hypothetical protein ACI814_002101, partial [Mariniblastus sp.]